MKAPHTGLCNAASNSLILAAMAWPSALKPLLSRNCTASVLREVRAWIAVFNCHVVTSPAVPCGPAGPTMPSGDQSGYTSGGCVVAVLAR